MVVMFIVAEITYEDGQRVVEAQIFVMEWVMEVGLVSWGVWLKVDSVKWKFY